MFWLYWANEQPKFRTLHFFVNCCPCLLVPSLTFLLCRVASLDHTMLLKFAGRALSHSPSSMLAISVFFSFCTWDNIVFSIITSILWMGDTQFRQCSKMINLKRYVSKWFTHLISILEVIVKILFFMVVSKFRIEKQSVIRPHTQCAWWKI